ncbi:MAG: PDZ domain-containing protein [Tenericutes bacterium]|nr:PDZ domain-containing protein [Mycoplasmatota bacterium]
MKIKNKLQIFLLALLLIFPLNTFAYSNYVISGGNTIGIEVNSKGVMVVGFYKLNDAYIAKDAGFEVGDVILKVNDKEVSDISSMVTLMGNEEKTINFMVLRNGMKRKVNLKLVKDNDNVLKTGLYVKDKINGIGTLTYIDPKSRVFGALGHEILESNTISKFEIKDGKIYDAYVSGIVKSRNGKAGEKNAVYNKDDVYGVVEANEISGIFGKYSKDISNMDVIKVGKVDDITMGKAYIRTVIDNDKVEDFEINIINLDTNSKTKNILFEITDKRLLERTGGVVQGMSGSPIVQDNKIIGAVNYVIVNDTSKGYGIFITTMLEEGDK